MMNLTDLPPELLFTIFLHLKTKFVLTTVTCVCKLFYHIITPDTMWKTRFAKIWPNRATHCDSGFLRWKEMCVQLEEFDEHWLHPETKFDTFQLNQEFPIDSVLLINSGKTLISGSRDRCIYVKDIQNISNVDDLSQLPCSFINVHLGWIWRLISDPANPGRFCSTSWDSCVKLWDLQNLAQSVSSINLRSPPLSACWKNEDILVAGCYDKTVRLIDPRTFSEISVLKNHTRSVLCLHVDDDVIVSGGEDKKLCVYDRRAGKLWKSIKLPSPAFSLHYWENGYSLLRVAGRGNIHLIDTRNRSFDIFKTLKCAGSSQRVLDFAQFKGALLSASTDGTLQACEPTLLAPPRRTLDQRKAEITRISVCGDTLASAASDGTICLWKMKL